MVGYFVDDNITVILSNDSKSLHSDFKLVHY